MRRFFITLLIDPHLSWERSPLPFMLSEASLIYFLLHLGWISVDLGLFLSLGVFPSHLRFHPGSFPYYL